MESQSSALYVSFQQSYFPYWIDDDISYSLNVSESMFLFSFDSSFSNKIIGTIFIDGTLVIVAMLYLQALHVNLFTCCFKVTGGYAARFVLNKLIRRVARD